MNNTKKFSINDIHLFVDDESVDFAIAKLYFMSDGNNSHKNPISLEVLEKYANTVLGKFVIAEYNRYDNDTTTHTENQVIIGYVSPNAEVKFEKKDGKTFATVDAVISKIYATQVYNLFKETNHRAVSCEFSCVEGEKDFDGNSEILEFNIHGITVLGLKYNPSIKGTEIKMVKFSEEQAQEFYSKHNLNKIQKFAKERKDKMESKTYKVNKTELKETPWGDIDKTELRNKVMKSKNKSSLVKQVYALVEEGWEDSPSEKLKYPIMELVGDTFYYNRYALSSALGYAKKENETEVISKIEKLYKKFKLDKEEGDKNMEEKDKDIKDKKMSLDINADVGAYNEMLENETERYRELAKELWEKEDYNVVMARCMEYAKKCEELENECMELRKFKEDKMMEAKKYEVDKTMAEVKGDIDEENFKKFQATGMECDYEQLDGWKNSVKSFAYEMSKNKEKKNDNTEYKAFGCDFGIGRDKSMQDSVDNIFNKYL